MTRRSLVSILLLVLLLSSSGFLGNAFRPRRHGALGPMDQMNSSLIPRFQLLEGSVQVSKAEARSLQTLTVQSSSIPESPPPISSLSEGFVRGRISVIMPAYNEARFIRQSILRINDELSRLTDDYEILVVNDGSIDSTQKIVSEVLYGLDGHVKLINHDSNLGKGSAFRTGFKSVTGEYTILTDSDSEIWARDLRDFVDAVRYGAADIAIGSKRHPLSLVQAPAERRFLSLAFNVLARIIAGVKVDDTQAGLKCVRSTVLYRIVPTLSIKRYALDLELLTVASFLGLEIKQLPVSVRLDAAVKPKRLVTTFVDVLGIGYRFRIKRWYQKSMKSMDNTYHPIIRL